MGFQHLYFKYCEKWCYKETVERSEISDYSIGIDSCIDKQWKYKKIVRNLTLKEICGLVTQEVERMIVYRDHGRTMEKKVSQIIYVYMMTKFQRKFTFTVKGY